MRFLADMGVNIRVVEWLRNNGHDAKHLREEGLHRMANGEIFAKALHENLFYSILGTPYLILDLSIDPIIQPMQVWDGEIPYGEQKG